MTSSLKEIKELLEAGEKLIIVGVTETQESAEKEYGVKLERVGLVEFDEDLSDENGIYTLYYTDTDGMQCDLEIMDGDDFYKVVSEKGDK